MRAKNRPVMHPTACIKLSAALINHRFGVDATRLDPRITPAIVSPGFPHLGPLSTELPAKPHPRVGRDSFVQQRTLSNLPGKSC